MPNFEEMLHKVGIFDESVMELQSFTAAKVG